MDGESGEEYIVKYIVNSVIREAMHIVSLEYNYCNCVFANFTRKRKRFQNRIFLQKVLILYCCVQLV